MRTFSTGRIVVSVRGLGDSVLTSHTVDDFIASIHKLISAKQNLFSKRCVTTGKIVRACVRSKFGLQATVMRRRNRNATVMARREMRRDWDLEFDGKNKTKIERARNKPNIETFRR
jgi:hypothetical protein